VAAQDVLLHLVAVLLQLDKVMLAAAQMVAIQITQVAAVAGHQRLELLALIMLPPVEMDLLLLLVVHLLLMLAAVVGVVMDLARLQHVPLAVQVAAVEAAQLAH
jgi:hypothetical protein